MQARDNVGVLYVLTVSGHEHSPKIRINGQLSSTSRLGAEFLVFCLSPGIYEISYEGERLAPDKMEFLSVEKKQIYVRDFESESQIYYIPLPPVGFPLPINRSRIDNIDIGSAKNILAGKRIGSDDAYLTSKHRCPLLPAGVESLSGPSAG